MVGVGCWHYGEHYVWKHKCIVIVNDLPKRYQWVEQLLYSIQVHVGDNGDAMGTANVKHN